MPNIDPNSPRQSGYDSNGTACRLGETDSEGYFVGWIDEEGQCWQSCHERDLAITAGRYHDAWVEGERAGTVWDNPPDPQAFARRYCLRPEHLEEAARAAAQQFDPTDPLARLFAHYRAKARAEEDPSR